MQDQQADEDYTPVVTAAMMWDMLPAEVVVPLCAEAGLIPPDTEGAAVELDRSETRRAAIRPLMPWIEVLAVIAAEIEGLAMVRPAGPYPSPMEAEILRASRDHFELHAHEIIEPAACAIISILVERGFLHVTDRGRAGNLDAFIGT